MFNVKTLPGADCGSDHELLSAYFKIKLKKVKQEKTQVRYDVSEINAGYKVEIQNRFQALMEIEKDINPDEFANDIRDIILETAKKHVPKRRRKNQPWISKKTYDRREKRVEET